MKAGSQLILNVSKLKIRKLALKNIPINIIQIVDYHSDFYEVLAHTPHFCLYNVNILYVKLCACITLNNRQFITVVDDTFKHS